jgi:hypothetical protein
MANQKFSASLGGLNTKLGNIIATRIASHDLTRTHDSLKKQDTQTAGRQLHYRYEILESIRRGGSNSVQGDKLAGIFRDLAETLENERAVAIPAETPAGFNFQDAWQAMLDGSIDCHSKLQPEYTGIRQQNYISEKLLHPLSVALLAYRMGGPINTVTTPHAHQWKLPEQSVTASDLQNFHMEGENASIFCGHRLSLVWEESNGQSRGVSGNHHVFMSGKGSGSKSLKNASLINPSQMSTASAVLYDVKNAALVYDCQEANAVRNSINLDFYVETMDDDILELLATPQGTPTTLTKLLLSYPIPKYSHHFHRLLFAPESLKAIVSKLPDISITPEPSDSLPTIHVCSVSEQAKAWHQDNIACIPPEVSMEHDIHISGGYASTAVSLHHLTRKAQRDIHLQIGHDLFPQDSIEENRECARQYIHDMPCAQVAHHLTQYEHALTTTPFVATEILSTKHLNALALKIQRKCWDLEGSGFIDHSSILSSLPCLVSALGQALDGPKEAQRVANLSVDPFDLQMYRTRCLYLFWCADWLTRCEPVHGSCMLPNADEVLSNLRTGGYRSDAVALLRNWVAWGMFVENLPSGLVLQRVA